MKVLAIGAHFDDIELGCGGTLLRHRKQGDDLTLLVVTHSGYESKAKNFKRSKEEARREGEKSAEYLGAELICCNEEPLLLTPTEKLVLTIEEHIDEIKPDRVYTHLPTDPHADHAAIGFVSFRASRKCDQVLGYRSSWYITTNGHEERCFIDISPFIEEKKMLMKLFESEMKHVNYTWIDFVLKQNSAEGARIGVQYAETFQLVRMVMRS